ncbi:ORF6N domain-containing protein [Pedobacter gandavensis]|uniref:ORF6N domain-containing protein n=1 Tax=Pedobacter gandavensis TaxID=2679963 RepID=UPI00292CE5CB|nr:ORF6N domain-containing protein [Pedobacter gandavensis]
MSNPELIPRAGRKQESALKGLIAYLQALLYVVETKQLKRQVKRNMDRFPEDFTFELRPEEYPISRSQSGTLKQGGNVKYTQSSKDQDWF